jgi:hypothetical protein
LVAERCAPVVRRHAGREEFAMDPDPNTEEYMSLGGGIFLIVVGAILAFALNVDVGWIDLKMVGYICLAAGVIITILGIVLMTRKRTSRVTRSTNIDPSTGRQVDTTQRDDPSDY